MRALIALAILPLPACGAVPQGAPNAPYDPAFENQTRAPALPDTPVEAQPFAGPLERPWGIASLPDGTFLVTERPGRMRLVAADGTLGEPIAGLPEVDARGQGGLLDVTASPDFAQDRTVFWTYAKPMGDGLVATAAARGRLSPDGTALTEVRDIFVQDPPSPSTNHYGSRVLFDDEGRLFVTTGEHSAAPARELAQDPAATWGKVVRVDPEGAEAEVWSLGHRNPQGAAIDPEGRLWIIEHGPLGGDELNLIEQGANYGWPVVSYGLNYNGSAVGRGEPRGEGFVEPVYYWDPVIAPGGMDFYEGALFAEWQGDLLIAGLQSEGLVRLRLEGDRVTGEERVLEGLGRVRDLEELPDGSLLIATDSPEGGLLRVTPD